MDIFFHIRILIGIVLSLSITHLLKGGVKFIEHPGKTKPYWVHLAWAFYIFLLLVHFWWWEIGLRHVTEWKFGEYIFLVLYIIIFYLQCVLLFPDDLRDYKNYEAYYYSRRRWFFGLMALNFVADVIDTLIKGRDYFAHLHWEYPVRNSVHFVLCLVAMKTNNKTYHAVMVVLFIVYELTYIFRFFNT